MVQLSIIPLPASSPFTVKVLPDCSLALIHTSIYSSQDLDISSTNDSIHARDQLSSNFWCKNPVQGGLTVRLEQVLSMPRNLLSENFCLIDQAKIL